MAVKVQKKKGTRDWYVVVHRHGRRTIKKIGTDKAKAEEAVRELEKELALRDLGVGKARRKAPTLKTYYDIFTDTYVSTATKPTTQAIYDNSFKQHILPVLGDKPLDEISPLDVQKLIANLIKKKQLGHTRIQMTVDVYTHWMLGKNREAMDRLPALEAVK